MLESTLIVGTTGSGKSYLLNKILDKQERDRSAAWVLIDPKRVELFDRTDSTRCLKYAEDDASAMAAITWAYTQMQVRIDRMRSERMRETDEKPLYIIIDEFALIMRDRKRRAAYGSILSDICVMGRAAHVFVVGCTQVPTRQNVPTEIIDNINSKVVLRMDDMSRARYVFGPGTAGNIGRLPRHGYGYVRTPDMTSDEPERCTIEEIIDRLHV